MIDKKLIYFGIAGITAILSTYAMHMIDGNSGTLNSILLLGFWYMYWRFFKSYNKLEKVKGLFIFSLILGGFFVIGNIVVNDYPMPNGLIGWGKIIVATAGYGALYYIALMYVYKILHTNKLISLSLPKKITAIFEKHPYMFSFIFLMCSWSIHLIMKYPAGLCWDVGYQIEQGLGNMQLTTHHPLAHTFLLTVFIRFGQLVGSTNAGMFLFVLVEAIVAALIFSYVITFLRRIKTHGWCLLGAIGFFAFSPYVMGYIGQPIKDFYYSVFCVFFITMLAECAIYPEYFWKNIKSPILFAIATLGVVLFRNNGSYIMIPTLLVFAVYELIKHKAWKRALLFILTCVISLGAFKALEIVSGAEKGSIKEALSLPFQQTARLVTNYPDSVTEEEKEIINKILPYDELPELYHEHISDPVKDAYNQEASSEDLKNYLVVWFKQFLREPGCYIKATVSQNIYLLYPGYNNYTYYIDSTNMVYPYAKEELFTTPEGILNLQLTYKRFFGAMHKLPVLYLLNNMAVYIIITLAMALYVIKDKDKRHFLYLLPCYLSLGIAIMAPVIRNNVRYTYPILYALPVIVGVYCASVAKKERENKSYVSED